MTASFNSHITISSPFGVGDLPTLCVWRNRLHRLNGEPEEDLDAFMEEHLGRDDVRTFAAYRDDELGGYFESTPGELRFDADMSSASVAKVKMCFKREFFKLRAENGDGTSAGGQQVTRPALNLVLRELFEEHELVIFVLFSKDRPIQSLVASVGAAPVGQIDVPEDMVLFVLSRPEWERVNAGFIAEYELAHPVKIDAESADSWSGFDDGSQYAETAEQAE